MTYLAKMVRKLPHVMRRHSLIKAFLRLRPAERIQEITFNGGARLVADLGDADVRNYFLRGVFEPEFFAIASPFLRKGGVFLDVGANFGFCSFGLSHALGSREVAFHLFEANANVCEFLQRSVRLNEDMVVTVNNCCVADRAGSSQLLVGDEFLGRSYISDAGGQAVPNVVLDHYISERRLGVVPFMKIDIEGSEVSALRGAGESLRSGLLQAIYLEVSEPNLRRAGHTAEELLSLLTGAGYTIYYCKAGDLEDACDRKTLHVNGSNIPVASLQLTEFPPGRQTDLLAIHPNSPWSETAAR